MIIKSIDIENFGKFSDKHLEFENGFNVISGKNGDGKSTVMAFIRLMFFGKSANDKSPDLAKNLRKKYLPWNGSPMSGSIEFEHSGCEYRLSKVFKKSAASDKTVIWNKTTGEKTDLPSSHEAGTLFFGMNTDEFERSVFIGQSGGFPSETSGESLAMRISNLAVTADETVSHKAVSDRLQKAIESLVSKSGKKGILIDERLKLEGLIEKRRQTLSTIMQQENTRNEIKALNKEIADLEAQKANAELKERLSEANRRLKGYVLLRQKLNALSEADKNSAENPGSSQNELSFEASQIQNDLNIIKSQLLPLKQQLNTDTAAAVKKAKKKNTVLFFILALLFALSVVLAAVMSKLFLIAAAVCAAAAAAFFKGILKPKPSKKDSNLLNSENAEYENVFGSLSNGKRDISLSELERTLLERLNEINEIIGALSSKTAALRDVQTAAQALGITDYSEELVQKRIAELSAFIEENSDLANTAMPRVELENELKRLHSRLNLAHARLTMPQTDIETLNAEINASKNSLNELSVRYNALNIAADTLSEAISESQSSIGSYLSVKTEEYLKKLSLSESGEAIVSKNLDIDFKENSLGNYHSWKYMSTGTVDRIYLALRLALTAVIGESHGCTLPIFIDDIMANFDDETCRLSIILLNEFITDGAHSSQLLLFTCHSYIIDSTKNNAHKINYIELN